MIDFTINRRSKLPIHEQLKHQFQYAILSGNLKPGDLLPSIRELTTKLKVNRNTIHRVYLELKAEGVLVSKAGKGIFVATHVKRASPQMLLHKVDDFAARVFNEGTNLGLNPISLSHLLSHRSPEFDRLHPSIAFVECTAHASSEVATVLSQNWGVSILNFELHELLANPQILPKSTRHLITSFFHEVEIQSLSSRSNLKTHIVAYDLKEESKELIAKIDSAKRVGFICKDENSIEILAQQVERSHPKSLNLANSCIETPREAEKTLAQSEIIVFTQPALSFIMERVSDKQELVQVEFELNEHSLSKVREAILPF